MLSAYPTSPHGVNITSASFSNIDPASYISTTLRDTFRLIERLTHNAVGSCFASLASLGRMIGKAEVTARRHVGQLVALGIIRREEIPGGVTHLFVCPVNEWKVIPERLPNETPLSTKRKVSKKADSKQLQPAPAPACPAVVTSPPPVVVSAATPQIQGEEIPDEISDVEPVSHNERLQPDAAPAPVSAPVSAGDQPLTPEQTATAREASAAGVPWKLAQAAVLEDSRRAQETLRALLAEQKRRDVRNPGAWFRVAFREAWEFGAKPQPGMASAAHLVAVPVGHNAVVPPPDAEADAVRSSMIAALRQRMGPRTRA